MQINFAKVYEKQNHSVGIAFYHIQFCTKYRYKMFSKFEYKNLIEACIRQTCFKHNIKIIVINVMPEHIHLVVKVKITFRVEKLLQLIKGFSSRLFFRHHPRARLRYPKGHLWSRGKFVSTVGFTDLDFTVSYVLHQEEHHSSSLTGSSLRGNSTL